MPPSNVRPEIEKQIAALQRDVASLKRRRLPGQPNEEATAAGIPYELAMTITDFFGTDSIRFGIEEPGDRGGYADWLMYVANDAWGPENYNGAHLRLFYDPGVDTSWAMLEAYNSGDGGSVAQIGTVANDGPYTAIQLYVNKYGGGSTLEGNFFSDGTECGLVMNSVASNQGPFIQLGRVGVDPGASGGTGQMRLYHKLVSGKHKFYAQFDTGSPVLIASEP